MNDSTPSPSNPFAASLTARESWLLGQEIAGLAEASLPLAEGLRMASVETSSRRLAGAMRSLAARLEIGLPLEEALREASARVPAHFLALVTVGLRSGSLAVVLQDFVQQRQRAADEWHSVRRALAYPIVILVLTGILFLFITLWLVPPLAVVLYDFQVTLPSSTRLMFWFSQEGLAWIAGSAVVVGALLILFRWRHGPRLVHALVAGIPFLGSMWRLGSWSQFSQLMALLLEHGVPLPDALLLTSEAVRDERLARATRLAAERCGQGSTMADALGSLAAFPLTLQPIVRWGEDRSALPDALHTAADMYSARLELQAQLVRVVAAPIAFLIVAATVLFIVGALLGPFILLIQSLSR